MTCFVDGCRKEVVRRHRCGAHYARAVRESRKKQAPCGTYAAYTRGCRCAPCKEAKRIYSQKYRAEKALIRHLPAAPLQELIRARNTPYIQNALRMNGTQFSKLMDAETVHYVTADRICLQLGVHPAHVWPREW